MPIQFPSPIAQPIQDNPLRTAAEYASDYNKLDLQRSQNDVQLAHARDYMAQAQQREEVARQSALANKIAAGLPPDTPITVLSQVYKSAGLLDHSMKLDAAYAKQMQEKAQTEHYRGEANKISQDMAIKTGNALLDTVRSAPDVETLRASVQALDPTIVDAPKQQALLKHVDGLIASGKDYPTVQAMLVQQAIPTVKAMELKQQADQLARQEKADQERNLLGRDQMRSHEKIAGMVDARAREMNANTLADRALAREGKDAEKKAVTNDKAVKAYSDTLQKNGIPEFESALSELEGQIAKYPSGKAPGLGRCAGLVPDWMQGAEGENIRQALAAVKNTLLKSRSGSAVTENELRRFVDELGSGGFRSEATLREGINRIRTRFEKVKGNTAAGVNDDVKAQYEAQGGVPIVRGGASKATGIPAGIDPKDWEHMTPDEKKLWKKN